MEKRTFLMYSEWQPLLEGMSDEQAGQLFKKIYAYQTGNEYEIQDALILGVFNMIKAKFDADRKLYVEKCERNKLNGAKGGRPKKQEKPKETERFSEKPKKFFGAARNVEEGGSLMILPYPAYVTSIPFPVAKYFLLCYYFTIFARFGQTNLH